jgi:hypothetical protein
MVIKMLCHCGEEYFAREADLKRGWGYSCSKSCAAKRRDFGLPKAKRLDGLKTKQVKQKPNSHRLNDKRRQSDHDYAIDWEGLGWDAHKGSF